MLFRGVVNIIVKMQSYLLNHQTFCIFSFTWYPYTNALYYYYYYALLYGINMNSVYEKHWKVTEAFGVIAVDFSTLFIFDSVCNDDVHKTLTALP